MGFATDPKLSARDVPIFWTPSENPATLLLAAAPGQAARALISGTISVHQSCEGRDGAYQWLQIDAARFAALALGEWSADTSLAVTILLDDDTPDRIDALTRFWSALRYRRAPSDPRLTPQRRHRLQQMLRAIDARLDHVSYRAIAEGLYPQHRIDAASWASNALRETTIRLVRDGMTLVNGGYRSLLRRPRRS